MSRCKTTNGRPVDHRHYWHCSAEAEEGKTHCRYHIDLQIKRSKKYRATPKGKATDHRCNTSAKGRSRKRKYAQTLGYALAQSRYQRRHGLQQLQQQVEDQR